MHAFYYGNNLVNLHQSMITGDWFSHQLLLGNDCKLVNQSNVVWQHLFGV